MRSRSAGLFCYIMERDDVPSNYNKAEEAKDEVL